MTGGGGGLDALDRRRVTIRRRRPVGATAVAELGALQTDLHGGALRRQGDEHRQRGSAPRRSFHSHSFVVPIKNIGVAPAPALLSQLGGPRGLGFRFGFIVSGILLNAGFRNRFANPLLHTLSLRGGCACRSMRRTSVLWDNIHTARAFSEGLYQFWPMQDPILGGGAVLGERLPVQLIAMPFLLGAIRSTVESRVDLG